MDSAKTEGYYYIRIMPSQLSGALLHSNSERAFVVSILQDVLSPRLLLHSIPAHKQLASCIDLLAFSIQDKGIELVVFSIDKTICRHFVDHLTDRLLDYQQEQAQRRFQAHTPHIQLYLLNDAIEAFYQTLFVHSLHADWEYDRYSSIGFYLHDRRGDWMRTWRLTRLYNNVPSMYLQSMLQYVDKGRHATWVPTINFPLTAASSVHG